MGLFVGIVVFLSGRFIDKFGVKKILLLGFFVFMIGFFYLVLIVLKINIVFSVCVSLIFMGLGMGFIMGIFLNYMMLLNIRLEEFNLVFVILFLICLIGILIFLVIMIGFIVYVGLFV